MGLSNSKELAFMNENALITDVAIRFGFIGAGQKGNKDADIFAAYTYADGSPIYPSLAINFSKTDMLHLKNISEEDRIHFDGFKGAARTPSLVVEAFDPEVSEKAEEYRAQLIDAMERKFSNVDHLIISAGGGGGFGTGFISLCLGLIKEQFFPVPVTLLVSIPIDDPTEMSNAILLLSEINEFIKLQDEIFGPGQEKPLGSVITTDNKKLLQDFTSKKDNRMFNGQTVSWKDESNDAIISTIHECNVIPANFGSDNVTYDPSDFVKLIQLSGGFLSIHKASLKLPFDNEDLKVRMINSIKLGYFHCDHNYDTASMYGGFVLRPSSAANFKDVKTELTIKKVITDFSSTAQGKFGDPIWSENYAVIYTMFAGMIMPNRVVELTKEYDIILEKQRKVQSKEIEVDIAGAMESVKSSSFNPYQKRSGNKFGGGSVGLGGGSVFSRKQEPNFEQEAAAANEEPIKETKKKFGGKTTETTPVNPWKKKQEGK